MILSENGTDISKSYLRAVMKCLAFLLLAMIVTNSAKGNQVTAEGCTVSLPVPGLVAGAPNYLSSSHAWFGSEKLAAHIPKDGFWWGMGPEKEYGDKFWWWSEEYSSKSSPRHTLNISARRLNGEPLSFSSSSKLGGMTDAWEAMLIGINFPMSGCWELIGEYGGHELKLVLQIGKKL